MTKTGELPVELRSLVSNAVALLGQVICHELGDESYRRIEKIRREMAGLRSSSPARAHAVLNANLKLYRQLSQAELLGIAHSFALMLELMNSCENAYRTVRLRQHRPAQLKERPQAIVMVLTAHPTEARSPDNIAIFEKIQKSLRDALLSSFEDEEERLRHLLEIAWRLLISRPRKPSVEDEAEHIYSILLREKNLIALLNASARIAPTYIRSWVGGDKDGHPGVDEKKMVSSLELSRAHLIQFIHQRFKKITFSLRLIHRKDLIRGANRVESLLRKMHTLGPGDGAKVRKFRIEVQTYARTYQAEIGALHPSLLQVVRLTYTFPALAVPLELRESSEIIVAAAAGKPAAITRMIRKLAVISRGGNPLWYARGLIISMAGKIEHITAAGELLQRNLGGLRIPVIPLFEQKSALDQSPAIVRQMLASPMIVRALKQFWNGHLEVMLGYSDSAKEEGVLPSRLAIADCVHKLDELCRREKVIPVFFHGSGGSIDRGGGSIQEQTAWWPRSALSIYKATIQGEMVERSFASPEILTGQIEKAAQRMDEVEKNPARHGTSPVLHRFADKVRKDYEQKIKQPDFLEVIQKATGYRYLSALKIGSRPTKRGKVLSVSSLRAIPWVLCWTQTRVLFPTWWGVGSAWVSMSRSERSALKRVFKTDALFSSYVKALGFTLAKVELPVWRIYLENSGLAPDLVLATAHEFEVEYKKALAFVRALSGCQDLLWFRPWLGSSIRLRSSMIHPLNLLQIITLQRKNLALIRETVAGISSGMMTTG